MAIFGGLAVISEPRVPTDGPDKEAKYLLKKKQKKKGKEKRQKTLTVTQRRGSSSGGPRKSPFYRVSVLGFSCFFLFCLWLFPADPGPVTQCRPVEIDFVTGIWGEIDKKNNFGFVNEYR